MPLTTSTAAAETMTMAAAVEADGAVEVAEVDAVAGAVVEEEEEEEEEEEDTVAEEVDGEADLC